MNNTVKFLVLIGLILYVLSPADLMPGPIDDLILIAVYALNNRRFLADNENGFR